jgi:hypothetical protein
MALRRVPVTWTTGPGGIGVSVFYSPFGTDATVELGAFFNSIKAFFPPAVSWNVPSSGDVVDDVTGLITGAWTGGTTGSIVGTGSGAYAAGTGCYVRWQTAGIVAGRRVKGRTFLAPMIGNSYQSDGTILDATLATINAAAVTLVGFGKTSIWHRPSAKGANDGVSFPVIGSTGPDKVTSLRSRRV